MIDEKIKITLSDDDISEITSLLNTLLEQVDLIPLSRHGLSKVDAGSMPGFSAGEYSDIVKTYNRFGIKDNSGDYHKTLNEIIARIALCNPLLQIYDSIQLLLFNKLIEGNTKFSIEEIDIFFLRKYSSITCSDIFYAGTLLYDIIKIVMRFSVALKSQDAKDFLEYGVSRRLFMLKKNIDDISQIYQHSRIEALNREEDAILDQAINASYANIYAIVDCLAFVIAFEDKDYEVERNKYEDLKKIGFYNYIRNGFAKKYEKYDVLKGKLYLERLKPWYRELCDLRHPVAHRIPLYFPDMYNDEEGELYSEAVKEYNLKCQELNNTAILDQDFVSKLSDITETRDRKLSEINLFSGCFLHSDIDSKKIYHLSRLIVDLGIMNSLILNGIAYIQEELK